MHPKRAPKPGCCRRPLLRFPGVLSPPRCWSAVSRNCARLTPQELQGSPPFGAVAGGGGGGGVDTTGLAGGNHGAGAGDGMDDGVVDEDAFVDALLDA